MKKWIAALAVLALFVTPLAGMAAPLTLSEIGLTVELPEGYALANVMEVPEAGGVAYAFTAAELAEEGIALLHVTIPGVGGIDLHSEAGGELLDTLELWLDEMRIPGELDLIENDGGEAIIRLHNPGGTVYGLTILSEDAAIMVFVMSNSGPLNEAKLANFETLYNSVATVPYSAQVAARIGLAEAGISLRSSDGWVINERMELPDAGVVVYILTDDSSAAWSLQVVFGMDEGFLAIDLYSEDTAVLYEQLDEVLANFGISNVTRELWDDENGVRWLLVTDSSTDQYGVMRIYGDRMLFLYVEADNIAPLYQIVESVVFE